ncbi:glycosyltransferase [Actinomycetota bacterium]
MIGYYVHHVGAGHRVRAGVIAKALADRGQEVVMLGSGLDGRPGVVPLARDDAGPPAADPTSADPTAGGALHWAPLHDEGLADRMAAISAWIAHHRPRALVVDVSVEVALLARLHGIPTVVVAQPGDRRDDAHQLGYRTAARILAPWPDVVSPCHGLGPWQDKVRATGGISRWSDIPAGQWPRSDPPRRGLVLGGRESSPEWLTGLERDLPEVAWETLGGQHWVEDPGEQLREADVIATHAGQNAVADVAAVGAPAVVVADERPHGEQVALARALDEAGLCAVHKPGAGWRQDIALALERRGRWDAWQTAGAPERAADVILEVAMP